ncbi:MAG: tetratricopeptide repeat protein [Planctomycetota bacterium]|nr:MAG: tetratricopeptide repeat protein [Planctomycetota bacterium]
MVRGASLATDAPAVRCGAIHGDLSLIRASALTTLRAASAPLPSGGRQGDPEMPRTKRPMGCLAAMAVSAALSAAAATMQDDSSRPTPTIEQADAYFQQQNWEKAAEAYEAITKASPRNAAAWFRLGYALHMMGKLDRAIVAHRKAAEFPQIRATALYNLGCAYALKKMPDEAFDALEQAVAAGMNSAEQLRSDSDLASLRSDPRFERLIERIGGSVATGGSAGGPRRDFDFWVGEWDVYNPQGAKVGVNRISRGANGYIILEEWRSANGGVGKSMNYFDPSERKWKQVWVSGNGGVAYYTGEFRDGAMRFSGRTIKPNGDELAARMVFTPQPGGKVRQFIEHSADGGKTWRVYFDGTYVPRGGAEDGASSD